MPSEGRPTSKTTNLELLLRCAQYLTWNGRFGCFFYSLVFCLVLNFGAHGATLKTEREKSQEKALPTFISFC